MGDHEKSLQYWLISYYQGVSAKKQVSPCHLVPSSRVRPPATTAVALLHLSRNLASLLMLLMGGHFMLFTLSSHLVIGLPRLLFPLVSRSMTSVSIPRSSIATCPKYLKAACDTPRFHCPFWFDVFQHPYLGFSLHPRHLASNTTSQTHQLSSSLLFSSSRSPPRTVLLGTPRPSPDSLLWQA